MDAVQPLRISKTGSTPASTPNKMPIATSRPLAEIGSTERRRNSPSYNQATRKAIVSTESSPYTENPSPTPLTKPSPREFWSGRDTNSPSRFDTENSPTRDSSPSLGAPKRRPSVERLMQASRVKNSNIFALESKDAYDPSVLPIVERPSANRPLSHSLVNNNFTRYDSLKKENSPLKSPHKSGHKRSDSQTNLPILTPSKSAASVPLPASPEKTPNSSPTKSSLSRNSQFGASPHASFQQENGDSEQTSTPRTLHRQAKSVTFHEEPPVVNEYEEQTPEPSLSMTSDREGSWDSEDFDDQDLSFDRGSSADPERNDDSFDADLENADKTPVVLPEDWSRMSPDEARTDLVNADDDVFDEGEDTQRAVPVPSARVASDGESSRPLPPLPAFAKRERAGSDSLSSAAERAANAHRERSASPPKVATISKDEILQMGGRSVKADPEEETPDSKASEASSEAALTVTNLDTGDKAALHPQEAEESVADLSEFVRAPPRISRESILRKVRNSRYDFEDFEGEEEDESEFVTGVEATTRPSIAELARMDPDEPIPSRENSRETSDYYGGEHLAGAAAVDGEFEEVQIKDEPLDEDAIDMNSIPAASDEQVAPPRSPSRMDDYDRQSSVLRHETRAYSSEDEEEADENDTASRYSSVEPDAESSMIHVRQTIELEDENGKETLQQSMQLLSVREYAEPTKHGSRGGADFMGLPTYLLSTDDYDFGMKEFITPTPPGSERQEDNMKNLELQPPVDFNPHDSGLPVHRPFAEPEVSPLGTPSSVIRDDELPVSPLEERNGFLAAERELPVVPERVASIKTPGDKKLKTRVSATPADLMAMAEQRRLVSAEQAMHPVPSIPQRFQDMQDDVANGAADDDASSSVYSHEEDGTDAPPAAAEGEMRRRKSRKSGGKMDLNLDTSAFSLGSRDSLGLDKDFERLIESQKVSSAPFPPPVFAQFDAASQQQQRNPFHSPVSPSRPHLNSAGTNVSTRTKKGYLMRQNTKVVVASNRNFSGDSNDTNKSGSTIKGGIDEVPPMSPTGAETPRPTSKGTKGANSSPRKASEEQFLKTEPWNGKIRRKSIRNTSAQKSFRYEPAAPPLPGNESALGVVDEDYAAGSANLEDDVGEGVERGRLFVKVVGVKDLELPLPRNDRTYFQLTLDNGLHCVTTTSLELGTNAPVGQEFELVVLNDLEFQLTLTTKLPPPPPEPTRPTSSDSPTKSPAKSQKSSGFARFLSSPKKRAEKERQEREAAEAEDRRQQEETRRKRTSQAPTAWDLLHELVNASDGSFARAYVNLNAHEKSCFGRALSVDIPCYNEWALEKDVHVVNSVRSKRGANSGPVRRPPYVIGQLQLQLLYVPKPKGATDEDMPKSMSSAIREMKKAGDMREMAHDGHLSQQGGDCTHWRRRYFRLQGSKLTAYHEHTHQKRAVINLSKASRLVDDKTMLVADPSPTKSGKGRRKSAFAEEDEAYQYVEEGFRMRFANGETIDFYADNRELKEQWMVALSQVIGKADSHHKAATWTDLVLARERARGKETDAGTAVTSSTGQNDNAPEIKDFGSRPDSSSSTSRPNTGNQKAPVLSKSAPTSPAKQLPRTAPMPPAAGPPTARPRTPPMSPRKGHRSRDAVKSMIF